ncbi:hypothetical protein GSI_10134 [Ganoderma sinense ZZ0214-1]|uniref:Uncharacterized protein n=1 Tax=Ganoderma sinense ZZ0214-1 TaxID=1077348 RepID=A0A2G8RZR5_9APHY|nr:hypothetical protein GSI_10134 [Ganoderma sinense ZZ0214-1]
MLQHQLAASWRKLERSSGRAQEEDEDEDEAKAINIDKKPTKERVHHGAAREALMNERTNERANACGVQRISKRQRWSRAVGHRPQRGRNIDRATPRRPSNRSRDQTETSRRQVNRPTPNRPLRPVHPTLAPLPQILHLAPALSCPPGPPTSTAAAQGSPLPPPQPTCSRRAPRPSRSPQRRAQAGARAARTRAARPGGAPRPRARTSATP